jgi:hypothetical protein
MAFLKSIVVGLLTVVLASPLLLIAYSIMAARSVPPEIRRQGAVAIDPVSLLRHSPILWLLLALVFGLAFFWNYRRATL